MAWRRKFEVLGHSLVELLQAEVDALFEDLGQIANRTVKAWALRAVVLAVGAVFLAVFTFTLIHGLAAWFALPLWGSGAIVAGFLLLVMGVLWWWSARILARLERPGHTLQRHVDSHLAWWRQQFEAQEGSRSSRRTRGRRGDEDASATDEPNHGRPSLPEEGT